MKVPFPQLRTSLSQDWESPPNTQEKVSSVILPIFSATQTTDSVILTKRASHLKSHPGQISFPGGTFSLEDKSLLDCALREWEEEMGESSQTLEIHGRLPGYETRTGFHITPFVARYSGSLKFAIDPEEVEEAILVPLDSLLFLPFYHLELTHRNRRERIFYFELEKGLLWGATCEILLDFLRNHLGFSRDSVAVQRNLPGPPFFDPRIP